MELAFGLKQIPLHCHPVILICAIFENISRPGTPNSTIVTKCLRILTPLLIRVGTFDCGSCEVISITPHLSTPPINRKGSGTIRASRAGYFNLILLHPVNLKRTTFIFERQED